MKERLKRYYCQADGDQWNVPVEVMDWDAINELTTIAGHELVGTATDANKLQYLIVNDSTVHEVPQEK